MPDPITWYALGRDILNNQKIIEEMQAEILAHNQDVSAHGQGSEAIYNHRIAELLDHVSYSIYNSKISPASRVYMAVVNDGLSGDFSGLQEAIDWTNLYGGGRILVKKGTYHIPGNLTLYSNIIIEGEDAELTILDFDNRNCHVDLIGTSGTHKRNIEFHNIQFANAGNTDDVFIQGSYADDCVFENCKFFNIHDESASDTICIGPVHCQRWQVNSSYFDTCDQALSFAYCNFIKAEFNYFVNCLSMMFTVYESPNVIFRHNNTYNCGTVSADSMIYFTSGSDNLVIDSNMFENCKTNCIWNESGSRVSITNNVFTKIGTAYSALDLNDCDRSVIANNRIVGWDSDGIYFADYVNYCTIVSNVITGCGGYGVNIDGVTCIRNLVVANCLFGNSNGTCHDAGTSSVVASNSG